MIDDDGAEDPSTDPSIEEPVLVVCMIGRLCDAVDDMGGMMPTLAIRDGDVLEAGLLCRVVAFEDFDFLFVVLFDSRKAAMAVLRIVVLFSRVLKSVKLVLVMNTRPPSLEPVLVVALLLVVGFCDVFLLRGADSKSARSILM